MLFRSRLLAQAGFAHAFTTRLGGVSAAPFDTLNLGFGVGDDPTAVADNIRRVAHALGCGGQPVVTVRQVHGAATAVWPGDFTPEAPPPAADAIVSTTAAVLNLVRVADCVPVLAACSRSGAVAAIHAGWRGLVAGAVFAAIERLCEVAGSRPERLLAAVGPCIGVEQYEVGEEVVESFRAAGLEPAIDRRWPRPHADLHAAAVAQIVAAGIPTDAVDGQPLCTAANPELFYSHRRDRGRTGRQAAAIVARASAS